MDECYYFGCIREVGHYWWKADGSSIYGSSVERLVGAEIWPKIDGGFCPGVIRDERGREKKTRPETEGEAALHHVNGWTILAFWDRSVDKRGACNSNFIVRGSYTFLEVMCIAKMSFPQVLQRLTFPIRLVATGEEWSHTAGGPVLIDALPLDEAFEKRPGMPVEMMITMLLDHVEAAGGPLGRAARIIKDRR